MRRVGGIQPAAEWLWRWRRRSMTTFARIFHPAAVPLKPSATTKEDDEAMKKINRVLVTTNIRDLDKSLDELGVMVSEEQVRVALENLGNAGMVAYYFFRWAQRRSVVQHRDPRVYELVIDHLARERRKRRVRLLLAEMEAHKVLRRQTFHIIMRRHTVAEAPVRAIVTLYAMRTYGFNDDVVTYNWLLSCLCRRRFMKAATKVFDKMKNKRKVRPNLESYNIMMQGWAQYTKLPNVMMILHEMQDMRLEMNVVTYSTHIHALLMKRKVEEALNVFKEMKVRGHKLDAYVYKVLIKGLCTAKQFDLAISMLDEMKGHGIVPDTDMYNSFLEALCKTGMFKKAQHLLQIENMVPNHATYKIIISTLIEFGKTEEAYSEFQSFIECDESNVRQITFELMVEGFLKVGKMNMAYSIWRDMLSRGLCPSKHSYCLFIEKFLERGDCEKAAKLFEEMIERGVTPPSKIHRILSDNCVAARRGDLLAQLAQKMDELDGKGLVKDIFRFRKIWTDTLDAIFEECKVPIYVRRA